ncbi:MAG TPA: DoxX family protein [Bryobacteraceae bacterium]|jgi:putative oxidoreductase
MWQKLIGTSNSIPLAIVRLMLGLVMFPHGAQKMLGWFGGHGFSGTMGFFTHQGIPAPLAFLAIAAEFFGGLGLIVGFLSRIAAFGVLCNMAVAVLTVHFHNGFFMNWAGTNKGEGFEYHLLAIAMALAVMIGGAGAPSVDRALRVRRSPADRTLP